MERKKWKEAVAEVGGGLTQAKIEMEVKVKVKVKVGHKTDG